MVEAEFAELLKEGQARLERASAGQRESIRLGLDLAREVKITQSGPVVQFRGRWPVADVKYWLEMGGLPGGLRF